MPSPAFVGRQVSAGFNAPNVMTFPNEWVDKLVRKIKITGRDTMRIRGLAEGPYPTDDPEDQDWKGIGSLYHDVAFPNKPWQVKVAIPDEEIDADQLGDLVLQAQGMGKNWKPSLANRFRLMCQEGDGTTYGGAPNWDAGSAFFAADHAYTGDLEYAGSVWSNLLTKSDVSGLQVTSTSAITTAEAQAFIFGVMHYMRRNVRNTRGFPMFSGMDDVYFVIPGELEYVFQKALYAPLVNSGESNVTMKKGNLVVDSTLTDALIFYAVMIPPGNQERPFHLPYWPIDGQEIKVKMSAPGSDSDIMRDTRLWKAMSHYSPGYGDPRFIARATIST